MRRITQIITALALPIPVLLAAEVLLQWHGFGFWASHFDPLAGPGLSLTLAVLAASWWAVAAWSRRWAAKLGYGFLALVASLVLLAGPLYQVTAPLVRAHAEAEALPGRLASLDAAIEARRAELDKYLTITASGRYGWHGRIDDARATLATLEARRAALAESAPESVSGQRLAAAGLQAVALILLQVGAASMAALAGRRLRAVRESAVASESVESASDIRAEAPAEMVETAVEMVVETAIETAGQIEMGETAEVETADAEMKRPLETAFQPRAADFIIDEMAIRRAQRIAERRIQEAGSAKRLCDREGLNPRDLSFFRSHFDRVKNGQPTVSTVKLQELTRHFIVECQAVAGV